MTLILRIALPTPLYQCFDYLPPQSFDTTQLLVSGIRVKVPFGRRQLVGVLVECASRSDLPVHQLKQALEIIDQQPLIPANLMKLYHGASRYYCYPLGEVIVGTLPTWFRQGHSTERLASISSGLTTSQENFSPSVLSLNEEQKNAIEKINASKLFKTFLLEGVTGSGKTEIYLQAIEDRLKAGQQALILIPEIGLTPQTLQRFSERFQAPMVVLNSGLSDKARAQAWWQAATGQAKIVIGTRSAIFVPLPALGIIILDEEHDHSFKQQSTFRYSARDCAVMRAQIENTPVVLGSATPSLESLYNAERGRYTLLSLSKRVKDLALPKIQLVDVRDQPLETGLSAIALNKIQEHLKKEGQVIIFLNRRGYSPLLLCHHCGWMAECSRCDVRLVYHKSAHQLRCHHCEAVQVVPKKCPVCQSSELIKCGQGTQKIEAFLQEKFPNQQILRVDRDSTRKKGQLSDKLTEILDNKANILIGTQMLAKGHHFPNLSLVVIVDLDGGFFSADFRAVERMGQLIVQVAGRAGREEKAGEVLIQTHQAQHPLLMQLLQSGYRAFAMTLLEERKATGLPPCAFQARLHAESVHQKKPMEFLEKILQQIKKEKNPALEMMGPMASSLQRKAGKYQAELIFQSTTRMHLHQSLSQVLTHLREQSSYGVRWALEVDP